MDLFIGMRIVSFGSFVLGVSTFTLCGWAYLSNSLENRTFEPNECEDDSDYYNITDTSPTPEEAFLSFRSSIYHATIIVLIVTVIQIVSAAVILGSALPGCRERAKIWFALNMCVNLVLLLCPFMTVMSGKDLQNRFPLCFIEIRNQIQHLDSYYVGVGIDFIVQFHALLACLLMLRYDRGRGYQLVEII